MKVRVALVALVTFVGVIALFLWRAKAHRLTDVTDNAWPLLVLYGGPLTAGLAAGLVAAAVSRAPWVQAAALGAASGAPIIFAYSLLWFGGIFLMPLALAVVPWFATLASSRPTGPRAWWPGPAIALGLVLVMAGAIAAMEPSLEGASIAFFRAEGEPPYQPLEVEGDEAEGLLGAVDREGRVEIDIPDAWTSVEELLRAFRHEELMERSRAAGLDPARFVVSHEGRTYEYTVRFEEDSPGRTLYEGAAASPSR